LICGYFDGGMTGSISGKLLKIRFFLAGYQWLVQEITPKPLRNRWLTFMPWKYIELIPHGHCELFQLLYFDVFSLCLKNVPSDTIRTLSKTDHFGHIQWKYSSLWHPPCDTMVLELF
jgi:hypothetical protein